jgi:putative transposase
MARPGKPFHLKPTDKRTLEELLGGGVQQVRVVLRALTLLQLDAGLSAPKVAALVGFAAPAVRVIARRYREQGLERALYERPRQGHAELLNAGEKQRIIAMVCSTPPEGRARWSVRLVAEEAVRRKLVPRVGRETIRVLLESHDLKPWREKNVVYSATRRRVRSQDGRRAGGV